MKFEPSPLIYVDEAPGKGLGVFARQPIHTGQQIEVAPVLFVKTVEFSNPDDSNLANNYVYYWEEGLVAVALGYGSLYNHAPDPNAEFEHTDNALIYIARRDIAPGEEITIHYHNDPDDPTPMHFEVK